MKARVTIQRGPGYNDNFMGEILKRSDTHLFVQHGIDPQGGEWFAISSKVVNCVVIQ